MTPLVQKLLVGQHPISLTRYRNIGDIQNAAERGLVLVKLTDKQGRTELGVQLENGIDNIVMTTREITPSGF